ncbi:Replication protein A 70 kDa DNA-binding subunit [Phytophthora palmivora]|uniref:Replication protein A 70 kDa DNA-binding subunit n=1 Tax=Phytophthora palmivora TaxID=4796 RepID=A0A2P4XLX0_9STRA|nr:Replication protein A 70 kDa DNA-binding subunit [Phytophthora palmivora]
MLGADHLSTVCERKIPIRELSPDLTSRWYVEARVINLAPLRSWRNPKGAAVRFSEMIQFDRVIAIHGGSLRKASSDYTTMAHPYDLLLSQATRVEVITDDGSLPHAEMAFVTIKDLVNHPVGDYIDVLAVVLDIGEEDCVIGKNGKVQAKRDLLLIDTSNVQLLCTLWNEFATIPVAMWLRNIIAIRRGRLTSFQGRSIGTTTATTIIQSPPYPEICEALGRWFDNDYDGQSIPIYLLMCAFTPIDRIYQVSSGDVVNVCAVVKSVATIQEIATFDGRKLHKRDITLTDTSNMDLVCAVWGPNADRVSDTWSGHAVAITSVRINDYNGRVISTRSNSSLLLEPPIEQTDRLKIWFCQEQTMGNSTRACSNKRMQSAHENTIFTVEETTLGDTGISSGAGDVGKTTILTHLPKKGLRRGKDNERDATKRHRSK